MVGYNLLKSKWSAEVESAKSNQQTVKRQLPAAIAMIRNNAVWIHGLIKHCLRSWTDKFGHFYACVDEITGHGSPPRENMSTTTDVACSAMQVKQRSREPWIQIGYLPRDQNFENIVMDSCVKFRECSFAAFHARSRKPRRSWIHGVKISKWRTTGEPWGRYRVSPTQTKIFPNLYRKESV